MDLILLLIALLVNLILYSFLIFIHFKFKTSSDEKIENYRNENVKTIELFRDELFKKNRRFELKYDIYKGFARCIPKIHWVITQVDWGKVFETFETIWFQGSLVTNFYGDNVKKKLRVMGDKAKEISDKRIKINDELNKISWERAEIEEQKKYLNVIFFAEPKN